MRAYHAFGVLHACCEFYYMIFIYINPKFISLLSLILVSLAL